MELLKKLGAIQKQYGFLPSGELEKLSEDCSVPVAQMIGSASFYSFFCLDETDAQKTVSHVENLYPLRKEGALLKYSDKVKWEALKKAKVAPDSIIPEISWSGLLGRSGSGFPVGTKWKLTAGIESDVKYVVCNADEGEPGTGKDRVILERNPYSVIEGMAICAVAVGAQKGFLYLREEYEDLKERLEQVIAEAPLDDFEIEVYMGHGAYVCGEETALINSIEGKRGETRLKPPFPGVAGLWEKPTVLNNVESFLCIPMIIREGAEMFQSIGAPDYAGSKLFTIFGAVQNPGVYELKPGLSLGACIEAAGGAVGKIQAILTGGGSGTLLRPEALTIPMTIKGCAENGASFGVASIRVISQEENLVSEVRKLMEFFTAESCGMCPPCRIGLERLTDILKKAEKGIAWPEDIEQLAELTEYIPNNARCGLGLAAVTPVRTLLKNFPEVLK